MGCAQSTAVAEHNRIVYGPSAPGNVHPNLWEKALTSAKNKDVYEDYDIETVLSEGEISVRYAVKQKMNAYLTPLSNKSSSSTSSQEDPTETETEATEYHNKSSRSFNAPLKHSPLSTSQTRTDFGGNVFVLKVLDLTRIDAVRQEDVKHDVRVLECVNHPNIAKTYEVYVTDDKVSLILEHCSGPSLSSLLEAGPGHLTEEQTKVVLVQVLQAVKYLHQHGVTYSALNLDTIMLENNSEHARMKLSECGGIEQFYASNTEPGSVAELRTLSPELVNQYPKVTRDSKADMWAIGVITYQLLSGSTPFEAETVEETAARIQGGTLDFKNGGNMSWDEISPEAKEFIQSLLRVNPAERYDANEALQSPWLTRPVPPSTRVMPLNKKTLTVSTSESVARSSPTGRKLCISTMEAEPSLEEIPEARNDETSENTEASSSEGRLEAASSLDDSCAESKIVEAEQENVVSSNMTALEEQPVVSGDKLNSEREDDSRAESKVVVAEPENVVSSDMTEEPVVSANKLGSEHEDDSRAESKIVEAEQGHVVSSEMTALEEEPVVSGNKLDREHDDDSPAESTIVEAEQENALSSDMNAMEEEPVDLGNKLDSEHEDDSRSESLIVEVEPENVPANLTVPQEEPVLSGNKVDSEHEDDSHAESNIIEAEQENVVSSDMTALEEQPVLSGNKVDSEHEDDSAAESKIVEAEQENVVSPNMTALKEEPAVSANKLSSDHENESRVMSKIAETANLLWAMMAALEEQAVGSGMNPDFEDEVPCESPSSQSTEAMVVEPTGVASNDRLEATGDEDVTNQGACDANQLAISHNSYNTWDQRQVGVSDSVASAPSVNEPGVLGNLANIMDGESQQTCLVEQEGLSTSKLPVEMESGCIGVPHTDECENTEKIELPQQEDAETPDTVASPSKSHVDGSSCCTSSVKLKNDLLSPAVGGKASEPCGDADLTLSFSFDSQDTQMADTIPRRSSTGKGNRRSPKNSAVAPNSAFRKQAVKTVAKTVQTEDIIKLREIFQAKDEADSGYVTIEFLKQSLAKHVSEEDMMAWFSENETIGLSVISIDWKEFLAEVLSLKGQTQLDRIRLAFKIYDRNNKGYITPGNLRSALGVSEVTSFIEHLIQNADSNKDGKIEFEELVTVLTRHHMANLDFIKRNYGKDRDSVAQQ